MEILVVGENACVGKKIFGKQGHSVRDVEGKFWLLKREVGKSRPDCIFITSPLCQEALDWMREKGLVFWGDSEWARALQMETYQIKVLQQLETLNVPVGGKNCKLSLEGWWNGTSYHFAWWYLSRDRLMNDDVGPYLKNAWVCGTSLRPGSLLRRQFLDVLSPFLARTRHIGPVCLDLSLEDGRPRIIQIQGICNPVSLSCLGELFSDPAQLLGTDRPRHTNDMKVAGLQTLLLPGISDPDSHLTPDNPGAARHVVDLASGQAAVVTSRGKDTTELRRRLYRTVSGLGCQDAAYRTDLGRGFRDLESELSNLGLL